MKRSSDDNDGVSEFHYSTIYEMCNKLLKGIQFI